MRENRSYGSVGERGGNEPLYPESYIRQNIENRKLYSDALKY